MRDLRLSLNGVRCFAETGFVRIAPLTLLVGENSTGKTSFLALLRTAWELAQGRTAPNFNRDPFFLGAFDQIAHHRGGKAGRKKHFSIRLKTELNLQQSRSGPVLAEYEFVFGERAAQPQLEQYSVSVAGVDLRLDFTAQQGPHVTIKPPEGSLEEALSWEIPRPVGLDISARDFVRRVLWMIDEKTHRNIGKPGASKGREAPVKRPRQEWLEILEEWSRTGPRAMGGGVFASAPVRTKPERTYNPVDDTPTSEGGHVPMALLKSFLNDKPQWERLKETLEKFGLASGLFEELSIKSLGRRASGADPFQIMIKVSGPKSNLVDVGYGVSQVLPILVDLMSGKGNEMYLLQQPEVHLHPRAQAELGSFLGTFAKTRERWVVAETHSDYIVDRLRMDIRDRKGIGPDDVSILYFERTNLDVNIHSLNFDRQGNLHGAPESYRSFFLREEERMLGIAEE